MKRWLAVLFVFALALTACSGGQQPATTDTDDLSGTLIIFHAGSLTVPVEKLTKAFQEKHPNVKFATESGGSRTVARKISELGQEADIMMAADYLVIDDLLVPDYADWNIQFARNVMVLTYTDKSKYANEINSDNWYQILLRDDVIYGHSDPNADPCGYRTLMVWQLAEIYYNQPGLYQKLDDHCPPANVRPKAVELLALLESGDMDYAFEYLSVAVQHNLKYVSLPKEINLGSPEMADYYAQAKVEINGSEPGQTVTVVGAPIVYGLTIPKNAPHPELAEAFLQFVLGPEGQAILNELGQPPLKPPLAEHYDRLPESLKPLVEPVKEVK
ncbi:MAG: tungstate ABC transporter substrate-binding protein WtpA [Chloroflexi bacterium]|nr:tungstate ABC transporter substrate-binding protein WtpA [Chloroflexota bacterium]